MNKALTHGVRALEGTLLGVLSLWVICPRVIAAVHRSARREKKAKKEGKLLNMPKRG